MFSAVLHHVRVRNVKCEVLPKFSQARNMCNIHVGSAESENDKSADKSELASNLLYFFYWGSADYLSHFTHGSREQQRQRKMGG